jgi:hypothetical protein
MYFGRGEQVPANLAAAHARARDARMKAKRELSIVVLDAIFPPLEHSRFERHFSSTESHSQNAL